MTDRPILPKPAPGAQQPTMPLVFQEDSLEPHPIFLFEVKLDITGYKSISSISVPLLNCIQVPANEDKNITISDISLNKLIMILQQELDFNVETDRLVYKVMSAEKSWIWITSDVGLQEALTLKAMNALTRESKKNPYLFLQPM